MDMVSITVSLATHFGWDLKHFDVKNTLLSRDLEEEIYMKTPL